MNFADILSTIKKSEDKRILVRVDFNVPLQQGEIIDDTRIKAHLPLIKKLLSLDAQVILISHLGRPKKRDQNLSLAPIAKYLKKHLHTNILLLPSPHEKIPQTQKVSLIENLRFFPGEETNDLEFAKQLSQLAPFYINDAFSVGHRKHASNNAIAHLFSHTHKSLGPLFEHEIHILSKVFSKNKCVYAIFGGAKVKDKVSLLNHLIDYVSSIFIGGAMAFTFFKALGYPVGKSLVDEESLLEAKKIVERCLQKNVSLNLPYHIIATKDISSQEAYTIDMQQKNFDPEMSGVDIGKQTIEEWEKSFKKADTIIWNGPMGIYENPTFKIGTLLLAKAISRQTKNCTTIVGGGDSVAAINSLNLKEKLTHISTGGGAMLAFLENNTLAAMMPLDSLIYNK